VTQIKFQIRGPVGEAVVFFEAWVDGDRTKFSYIVVDILRQKKRILINVNKSAAATTETKQ